MDGSALLFCEGALGTPAGRTTTTLLREGERYDVVGVVDSRYDGRLAGEIVAGAVRNVPVFASVAQAIARLNYRPDYLVLGLDPPDGRLEPRFRRHVAEAIRMGLNVDSALRPFLHDDPEFPGLAMQSGSRLRSVGRTDRAGAYRRYTNRAASIEALKIAVVGTNVVGGKIVTAVRLARALRSHGLRAEVVGTSTLAWFQGIRHAPILDAVPQEFVGGEVEGAMLDAHEASYPDALILEGRGGLLNPAHPCDLELLTTARPDAVVLQHAPTHASIPHDDPFGLGVVTRHARVIEAITGRSPAAVTLGLAGIDSGECREAAELLRRSLDCLVVDVLAEGVDALAARLLAVAERPERARRVASAGATAAR